MNDNERIVREMYERDGWNVIRSGYPDFLMFRGNLRSTPIEIRAVEVKSDFDRIGEHQQMNHEVLERAGIRTFVVWVDENGKIKEDTRSAFERSEPKPPEMCCPRCGECKEPHQRLCSKCWEREKNFSVRNHF